MIQRPKEELLEEELLEEVLREEVLREEVLRVWLSEVSISGFRNLASQTLGFDPKANLIFGPNGSGKTNLLESIAVLAAGRSFRTFQDDQLLAFDAPHFQVVGRAQSGVRLQSGESSPKPRKYLARVYFSPAERKHYFLDKHEVPKRSLYAGWLPITVFLLDDRRLVAGPPAQRRAFADDAVGKVSRTYRFVLSEFRRVLAQRNALLRRRGKDDELAVWEKRLAEQAKEVSQRRNAYWKDFAPNFERMSRRFLPADEIALQYHPNVREGDDYRDILACSRQTERRMGFTCRGPHRDDFRILLNSRSLRAFGSYGQQRLVALALSLAEAETALAAGRKPVYLMDDVAAELDDANARQLFNLIGSKGQLFYASARPPAVEGRRFHVRQGKIRQV